MWSGQKNEDEENEEPETQEMLHDVEKMVVVECPNEVELDEV